MEDTITKIYGGKWWKTDFHVHTPASEDYGKGSENPEDEKNITPKEDVYKRQENTFIRLYV